MSYLPEILKQSAKNEKALQGKKISYRLVNAPITGHSFYEGDATLQRVIKSPCGLALLEVQKGHSVPASQPTFFVQTDEIEVIELQ